MRTVLDNLQTVDGPIRHKDYKGSHKTRPHKGLPWDSREFIAWDGEGIQTKPAHIESDFVLKFVNEYSEIHGKAPEGWVWEVPEPQPYVLLANSKGDSIINEEGLPTQHCFEFILDARQQNPMSVFVGFGFNYDVAQMIKDLGPLQLKRIYDTNVCHWMGYRLEWRPKRWFRISHKKTHRTATIYDVIGFFQSSFLTACEKYLGKDDPDLTIIKEGKAARDSFTFAELDSFIIPYNKMELSMLVTVMNRLREYLHEIGLDLGSSWYGPGAVANQLLNVNGVKTHKSREIPQEVLNASRFAYAGGRFEHYQIGSHQGPVYEYDIRSAYPSAATQLPSLSEGYWEPVTTFEPDSFGVWHIRYRTEKGSNQPQPLFCRSRDGRVSFPRETDGWYWTPEASLVPDFIERGHVWRPANQSRPFEFVRSMYEQRKRYVLQGNPCERAIKLALNSIYGKLAQCIGGKEGKPPSYHQLEWAGYITSYVRSMIYKAVMLNPSAIIATETDAVFSTEPLDLELGEELGQWELTRFTSITYLQSGFYYATEEDGEVICRYRGMDRDRATGQPVGLPYRTVLDHLSNRRAFEQWRTPPLHSTSTRFINIGLALRTNATFRSWETQTKTLYLDQKPGKSKRYHMNCSQCQKGYRLTDCLHPMEIGGYSGFSHPHPLPWIMGEIDEDYENFLTLEVADRWQ